MIKIAKTYREFNKIKRKYNKRHTIKRVDHFNGRRFTSYWEKDDWLGYIIKSYEELKQPNIYNEVKWMVDPDLFNAKLKEIEHLYKTTEPVTICDNGTGYFRGIMLTNRDAYYLLEDNETKENKLVPFFWDQGKANIS